MLHTAANARTLAVPLGRRCLGISGALAMPTAGRGGETTTVNMQEVPEPACAMICMSSDELIERIEGRASEYNTQS